WLRLRRAQARHGCRQGRAQGRDRAGAAGRAARGLVAPPSRAAARARLRLDERACPRPPGRRGAAARDLRPRRLGRVDRDHPRGRLGGGLGDPWARGRAGALCIGPRHRRARPLAGRLRRRGMKRFARLLDQLSYQSQRNAKLRLLTDYFTTAPDPDRGFALAALTGDLVFRHAKAGLFRDLAASRTDPMLFALSYDYVGDLAETVALIWLHQPNDSPPPDLATIVETLEVSPKAKLPTIVSDWLDRLDATGRWALIKFVTGSLRIGISARLAKTAIASLGKVEPAAVEEVWHALEIPYRGLFEWLEGRGPKPDARGRAAFRPPMLAQPLEPADLAKLKASDFIAAWKWDGARVPVVGEGALVRLY